MVGFDPEVGTSVLRLWIAAGAAAVLAASLMGIGVLVSVRWRKGQTKTPGRSGAIALSAVLGAAAAIGVLEYTTWHDHDGERRALQSRAEELAARSFVPGSPLACLDALAGDTVAAACEKALFASPESVASATAYVAARFSLLSDMTAYLRHGGTNIDSVIEPLRRSLETDRFGFLAHALAMRDGCTDENCKALAVLQDSSRVRAHLSAATLDRYLDRYLTAWAQPNDGPVADAAQSEPSAALQSGTSASHKVVNIDFPSASSIPPISIINPEPPGKTSSAAAPPAAAGPSLSQASGAAAPASVRHSHKQAATPPAQAAPPNATSADAQSDPVWTPAPVASPQTAATGTAPAANFAGAAPPMQLGPAVSPQ